MGIHLGSATELKPAGHDEGKKEMILGFTLEELFKGKLYQEEEAMREISAGDFRGTIRFLAVQLGAPEPDKVAKEVFIKIAPSIFSESTEELIGHPEIIGVINPQTIESVVDGITKTMNPKEE